MMRHDIPLGNKTSGRRPWRSALLGSALLLFGAAQAQVLFNEQFTGGVSSTGFTVNQLIGTTTWTYNNPGGRTISGENFDADFAMFDSDNGGDGDAQAELTSPAFDASSGTIQLDFDHQFRYVSPTIATVEVWNGTAWTVVYTLPDASVGYPNPAAHEQFDITAATGASSAAQVKFVFHGDWRWWWALDNIQVTALSCTAPAATATIMPDCPNGQFSVSVDLTSLGDAASVDITENVNGGGEATSVDDVSAAGTYVVGPYSLGDTVQVRVIHNGNNLCDLDLGIFTFALNNCPIIVTCGTPWDGTHCYADDEAETWLFQPSDGTSTVQLAFSAGFIENCCDQLRIFDGMDDTGTLLFDSDAPEFEGDDLTGITVTAASGSIFMDFSSDGSVSCDGNAPWAWTVNCLACTQPAASAEVIPACPGGFGVDVDVSSLGDGASAMINYSVNGADQTPIPVSAPGTTSLTGFVDGDVVAITIAHANDSLCNLHLGSITYFCPATNDDCANAIALTVNPNYNCGTTTLGTVIGATDSGVMSTECNGTADDDVWFTFTATDTLHRISLENIEGSTVDMYMSLWTGDCGNLVHVAGSCSDPQTLDIGGLTIGTTYYLQVYTWTSTTGQTSAFDVCVGSEPFCQPPLAITLDSISAPDATVSFTDNGAMEYQYELRVSGDVGSGATGLVEEGTVTASPLNLTGLVADSLYTLYIRSICSVGDTSAWSDGLDIFDGYCNMLDFTNVVEPICNVTFAGINHDSDPTVDGSPALEDFTAFSAFVGQGGSYPISVTGNTVGDFTTYITAFFDWDGDQIFETTVEIGSLTNDVCTQVATTNVVVPADATIGITRMRVVKNFNVSPLDACGTYGWGQGEDYSVEVGTVGVAEVASTGVLTVYPNPASTELQLRTASGAPVNVQVYDLLGNLVLEQASTSQLHVANLAPGSYILRATDNKGNTISHVRFVKQ